MTLKEKINEDFLVAYKAKNMFKKNFLGVLKGAIQTQEGKNIPSTDENVLKVIKSIEKGINETIDGLIKVGLDTTEQALELSYLSIYLPTVMSEEAIKEIVLDILSRNTNDNLGFLMGIFNKENSGKPFDNKTVAKVIKETLLIKNI